jgi:phosphate transport system ATP-binding protein
MGKIDVRNLSVYYSGRQALADVDMEIKERQITAPIGRRAAANPPSCAASTAMNDTIPGVEVRGEVLLEDDNIYAPRFDVVALRQRVGMVFQRPNPFPKSVYDNVAFGPRVLVGSASAIWTRSSPPACRAPACGRRSRTTSRRMPSASPWGSNSALSIARVIAVEPVVILMDEPASALDPIATLKIEDLMRELVRNYTIVIVTHNMQQAARVSDWTAFFLTEDGRIGRLVEYGATHGLFTNPADKRTENYITGRFG